MRRRMRCTSGAAAAAGALPAVTALAILWAGSAARADVTLPALISDGMVIQENAPIHLWGRADDGEKVTATFAGARAATTAQGGRWSLTLPPAKAKPGGPYTLTIAGRNTITLNNVLLGEVWVCSGQSNMEFPLSRAANAATEIPAAANPNLRLFLVKRDRSDAPQEDVTGSWKECTPQTVPGFSAVGYFFGRDLAKARKVPVGLIATYWGGTPAESWTPEASLAANPVLKPILDGYPAAVDRYQKALAAYPDAVAKAQAAGKRAPRKPAAPWRYSELYNAMIAPLVPYSVAGATWYQGESNAGRAAQYRTLLPAMIQGWRQAWGEPRMPFLIVQLAPYMAVSPEPEESSGWAELREAQDITAATLPQAGMAVITDVGDAGNIHPTRKEPVGARLALLARRIAYGEKIDALSPSFRAMTVTGGKAVLTFDNVGPGLEARPTDSRGEPVPAGTLVGFAVAGRDGRFVWADAKVTGKNTVEVSSPQVPQPAAVRYGWANFPVVNLWSKNDLPAAPFRTDAPRGDAAPSPMAKG